MLELTKYIQWKCKKYNYIYDFYEIMARYPHNNTYYTVKHILNADEFDNSEDKIAYLAGVIADMKDDIKFFVAGL